MIRLSALFRRRPGNPGASQGFLARLRRDLRGVAAVEFALIAPVMILGYFGVAEVTMAMMAHRRASHAASAVGDLVAQSRQMDQATMTDIFTIGSTMMRPFEETPLKVRVTSIKMDAAKDLKVVWSKGSGVGGLTVGSKVADAELASLLQPFGSMIMAEMTYSYKSPFGQALPDALSFSDTFYLKPRQSDEVTWVGP